MAIVKCENKSCKYFEEGFYCTRSIVEMTDGKCDYWELICKIDNANIIFTIGDEEENED